MQAGWMLYGASGYTGRLIAEEAVARGLRPVLAGRREATIRPVAEALALPWRAFAVDGPEGAAALRDIGVVLNCAGPFSATAAPLIDRCLAAGASYLDITGEIDAIEQAAARDSAARQAGVSIVPAVGFDVVPSDCLAAQLAAELPDAERLELAFWHEGGMSQGTAKTTLEALPRGGRIRREGKIVRVPVAWKEQRVAFSAGSRWTMTIPWGDVASAWYTTGIPQIETYTVLPRRLIRGARWLRWFWPLLGSGICQRVLQRQIERRLQPPDAQARAASRAYFWGRVTDRNGRQITRTLDTPGGYALTILTALRAVERTLAGTVPAGFHTPAKAFGARFIEEFPGVKCC